MIFSANSKIDSLYNKLTKTSESIERIELLITLSLEYVEIDTIKSLEFNNQALELSDQLGKHKARAIGNSGYIHYLIGNYEISLKLLLNALTQLDLENNLNIRANILEKIGFVYKELKKYNRSLEYFPENNLLAFFFIASSKIGSISNPYLILNLIALSIIIGFILQT